MINFDPFEKLVKFAIEALEFTGRSAIYTRLVVWLRMLTAFVSLEVAAQACAVVASFLVLRNLDKSHYAWYSLAFNLQSTLGNFTLLGIGTGMTSMAGQWIADPEKLGALAASAFRYRSLLRVIAGPLVLPAFGYLLLKNGCPPWHTLALVLLAVCLLFVELNRQIFSSPISIAGRYNYLQQAALLEGISRVAILSLLISSVAERLTTLGIRFGRVGRSTLDQKTRARVYCPARHAGPRDPAKTDKVKL